MALYITKRPLPETINSVNSETKRAVKSNVYLTDQNGSETETDDPLNGAWMLVFNDAYCTCTCNGRSCATWVRQLLLKIMVTRFFSVIAEVAADVAWNKQFFVVIRWVSEEYEIHIHMKTPMALYTYWRQTQLRYRTMFFYSASWPLSQCEAQAYIGSANMSGHICGVAARLKAEEPPILYIYC